MQIYFPVLPNPRPWPVTLPHRKDHEISSVLPPTDMESRFATAWSYRIRYGIYRRGKGVNPDVDVSPVRGMGYDDVSWENEWRT